MLKKCLRCMSGEASPPPPPPPPGSCPLCRRACTEPRVLPCLHTFCAACLLRLPPLPLRRRPHGNADSLNVDPDSGDVISSGSSSPSAGSGYESGLGDGDSATGDCGWGTDHGGPGNYGVYTKRVYGKLVQMLVCPLCGFHGRLPPGGVPALPPNLVLQHKVLVRALQEDHSRLLCDLCQQDTPATSRCATCLISLCATCAPLHAGEGADEGAHTVLPLAEAARRGALRLRRQPLCSSHPERELKLFCSSCSQVICADCCLLQHLGHTFLPLLQAADTCTRRLREAVERARPLTAPSQEDAGGLRETSARVQIKSSLVQEEVQQFISCYLLAVEQHGQQLQQQVLRARGAQLRALSRRAGALRTRAQHAVEAVRFTEEVLQEGTPAELLGLAGPLLQRLEWVAGLAAPAPPLPRCTLELVREEPLPPHPAGFSLCGAICTQAVDPAACFVYPQGLQGARALRACTLVLRACSAGGVPVARGGAQVTAVLRRPGTRPRTICVQDDGDGTYRVCFTPDAPGLLYMAVLVDRTPIKGSPFTIPVRRPREHLGHFHCCTFCSSGGSRLASCACGARMPGGYRGCGHGHQGHPGCRHWSCCANTNRNSDCQANKARQSDRPSSAVYQVSL